MNITRHNYEEFFLLYLDKELNEAERKEVEEFVQLNPDLREEFDMLQHTTFPPDEQEIFFDKESLLRFDVNGINDLNHEEYFVQ